jgi:phosphoribosylformylglycinamidine (FGAM) synthase-like enzyme
MIDPKILDRHGLKARIRSHRHVHGPEPNLTELGIFSVLMVEHCSYRVLIHLKTLPTEARGVAGPGENAGAWTSERLRGGLQDRVAQSSIVHRTVGAAAVWHHPTSSRWAHVRSLLNSLRFDDLDAPGTRRPGVVACRAGNSIGIRRLAAIVFEPSYAGNPLVTCSASASRKRPTSSKGVASGVGSAVYMSVRRPAGMAFSATVNFGRVRRQVGGEASRGRRSVHGKLLEACLEVMQTDALIGIRTWGRESCSTTEMGSRGAGVEIDVSLVRSARAGSPMRSCFRIAGA